MSGKDARARLLDERDQVIQRMRLAQQCLDVVQPESLRETLYWWLESKIKICESSLSVLGLPVNYAIDAATKILDACDGRPDDYR